ncbi:MAG: fasciclin domain-containing protein [Bryobacteraceae bacterium]|nr:fasciclin domain-containing protein [Bryobacteraceae bacterium]
MTNQGTGVDESLQTGDILETAHQLSELQSFVQMLERSGLASELREPNSRTLFAPVNRAFESMPGDLLAERERLGEIVAKHIVKGRQTEADLRLISSVKTISGDSIPVEFRSEGSRFGRALIIKRDIACRNGLIHLLDQFAAD